MAPAHVAADEDDAAAAAAVYPTISVWVCVCVCARLTMAFIDPAVRAYVGLLCVFSAKFLTSLQMRGKYWKNIKYYDMQCGKMLNKCNKLM